MITIYKHKAYSKILSERDLERPNLPLVEMELTEQEIGELKKDILELEKANHLETCGREIAMCFAYWFQHEYNGGNETKRAEEVAEFIGLERKKGPDIAKYGLNALKAWGVEVSVAKNGNQRILGTLLDQGGTPYKYILQLVDDKGKKKQKGESPQKTRERDNNGAIEVEQNRTNYLGFLTALLRESPNYSSDWDKAIENAYYIVCQLEAADRIPDSLRTPYQCEQYILMIRGIVEGNEDLIKNSLGKETQDLVNKLKNIYNKTNKEVKDLTLRWKLSIEQGQILQYYSLTNYNLIDPKNFDFATNNCNSFDLIVGNNRLRYMRDMVDNNVLYRYRPQMGGIKDMYYDGMQPYIQAQILLGGQLHTIKLKNDTPINFATPQILKKSSDYYIQSSYVSETDNIVIFNDEWHCNSTNVENVTYDNEKYYLINLDNTIKLTNNEGKDFSINSIATEYSIEIKGTDFGKISSPKYILAQDGPEINVRNRNGEGVNDECSIVYRVHQKYNDKWKTKEDWRHLPIGFLDVKIILPDGIQKSYTFFELGNLIPQYIQADGDTTIINWNIQDYRSSSVSIEETDSEYFQIEKLAEYSSRWRLSRHQGVAYSPICTFHLKANSISPIIDIQAKTLFKANFITEVIDGKHYELENGKVLSYSKIEEYAILVSNENDQDVPLNISYISNDILLETKEFTVKCDHTVHKLSDYKDAIDELIEKKSHLHGFATVNRKLEIKIGDNRTYYLREYAHDIEIHGQSIKLSPDPGITCHLKAIPIVDPVLSALTVSTSPLELTQENGSYHLSAVEGCQKYLIYSSIEDEVRAIPKILNTTRDLDDNQRREENEKNTKAWVNALKRENCTERGRFWDRCARYYFLAYEQSIHYSAFNCINAVMSDDFLLAKFIVHMIFIGKEKTEIIQYLKSLEHEFLFSSCWISKNSWYNVKKEVLPKFDPDFCVEDGELRYNPKDPQPGEKQKIEDKRMKYIHIWQPAIFEIRSAIFSNTAEFGSRLFSQVRASRDNNGRRNQYTDNKFRENIAKLWEATNIPFRKGFKFEPTKIYYSLNPPYKHATKQYLMASMYLAEVLCDKHKEIWKDENYRIRKQLLLCQDFQSDIFTELVTNTLNIILGNIKHK